MGHDVEAYNVTVGHNSPAQTKAVEVAQNEATQQKHKVDDLNTVAEYRKLTGIVTPSPTITTLTPNTKATPTAEFDVVLTGTGFPPWAIVYWNGAARPTTYTSPTSLTVKAPATISPGAVGVYVATGASGGSSSSTFTFT